MIHLFFAELVLLNHPSPYYNYAFHEPSLYKISFASYLYYHHIQLIQLFHHFGKYEQLHFDQHFYQYLTQYSFLLSIYYQLVQCLVMFYLNLISFFPDLLLMILKYLHFDFLYFHYLNFYSYYYYPCYCYYFFVLNHSNKCFLHLQNLNIF